MGNSAIASIYAALYALAPTVSTDNMPTVQAYGSVNEFAHSDDLPMRKLQAFANESGSEFAFVALGTTATVRWTIVDRLFYRVPGQGRGWQEFADDLTTYAASYINILRTNRALTAQSHVVEATFTPRIFTFPEGGNTSIAGVDVVLTVEEVIT